MIFPDLEYSYPNVSGVKEDACSRKLSKNCEVSVIKFVSFK